MLRSAPLGFAERCRLDLLNCTRLASAGTAAIVPEPPTAQRSAVAMAIDSILDDLQVSCGFYLSFLDVQAMNCHVP